MKLPFLWISLGLLIGISFYEFHVLIGLDLKTLAYFIPFLFGLIWLFRGTKYFLILFVIIASLLGYIHASFYERSSKNAIENFVSEDAKISLEGVVITDPEIKKKGKKETVSFILQSKNIMTWVDGRSQLHKTIGKVQVFSFQPKRIPNYGDIVRVKGYLENPKSVHNPGEFDYKAYLKNQKIHCLLRSYGNFSIKIYDKDMMRSLFWPIHQLRLHLEKRIESLFLADDAAILKAVLLGRKKAIPPDSRDAFMKTGTAHLLAISGLHMAIIAGSFYFLLLICGLGSRWSSVFSILFVLSYISLAGAGFPVRRAGWMAIVVFMGTLFGREKSTLNTFFFALSLILFIDPKAPSSLSFQLSFVSVFSMMLLLKNFKEQWKWSEAFFRTFAVMVGTLPIILLHFNVFSITNFVANIFAIPVFHIALVGGLLSLLFEWVPFVGTLCIGVTHLALKVVLFWIESLASFDWGYFFVRSPEGILIVGYYLSLLCFLWVRNLKIKFQKILKRTSLCGTLFFGVLFFIPNQGADFQLTVLYMGKNEVSHLRTPDDNHWLLNTGKSSRWTLEPYLKSQGVKRLAGIFLASHYKKHTGGLADISRNFIVNYLFTPILKKELVSSYLDKYMNRILLHQSKPITAGRDVSVESIAVINQRATYLIRHKNWAFLALPSFSSDMELKLESEKSRLLDVQVLMLPFLRRFEKNDFDTLMEFVDPEVVTVPNEVENLRSYLNERDITLLSLKDLGALRFQVGKDDKLRVASYLKGMIKF